MTPAATFLAVIFGHIRLREFGASHRVADPLQSGQYRMRPQDLRVARECCGDQAGAR
jgi:hypothetical protein